MTIECQITPPRSKHTHTVILLHGRGSDGEEFSEELFESTTSDGRTLPERFPAVRWILPTASARMSTVFQEEMTEWFDIYSLSDPESRQDLQVQGLVESIRDVHSVIDDELKLVAPSKLILGGISQGCATAIHALLSQGKPLAAFVGICGWLPFAGKLEGIAALQEADSKDQKLTEFYGKELAVHDHGLATRLSAQGRATATPVFLCHGTDDNVVDVLLGRRLRDASSALNMTVTWKEHDECGHWIKEPDGIDALAAFLERHMEAGITAA